MEKIKNTIQKIDFKFDKVNYIALFAVILSLIFVFVFNIKEIYENSILENTQVVVLFVAMILCFKFKNNKILFNFIGLVILLMFLRELSYGRVIFAQLPDNPHEFYRWSHYKYGFLANIIIGIYIGLSILYALINKIHINIISVVQKVNFPFWTLFLSVFCVIVQLISEKTLHNTIIEETSELALYCLILGLVLIYKQKLK